MTIQKQITSKIPRPTTILLSLRCFWSTCSVMSSLPAEKHIVAIDEETSARRLDKALADALDDISRARIRVLIETGQVTLVESEATILDPSAKVKPGQHYQITIPPAEDPTPKGQDIPLVVVYEDDNLIVIDKPPGLVVHPAPGHEDGTLVNALIAHCGDSLSGIGGVKRPGIVHRIDKDTSGLLVVAKNDKAHQGLAKQFAVHSIERAYSAICWWAPRPRKGRVNKNIARSRHNRQKMAVVKTSGREAVTHYQVKTFFGGAVEPYASLVECRLQTGRTHQIRVHMEHIGHPVIGDPVYGRGKAAKGLSPEARKGVANFNRQALHAGILGFDHPITGKALTFESKLPNDMEALVKALAD
jgi:23S rRNA pseudouridine1911/1915/1917 synthase